MAGEGAAAAARHLCCKATDISGARYGALPAAKGTKAATSNRTNKDHKVRLRNGLGSLIGFTVRASNNKAIMKSNIEKENAHCKLKVLRRCHTHTHAGYS